MIKFIATDMDGTLLNSEDQINPEFFDIFEKLKDNNIIFAAASGRQYFNLKNRFKSIQDDMMFIAENGTFVVYKGEEILVNALDRTIVNDLIKVGRDIENSHIVLCGKKSAYVEDSNEEFLKQVQKYYKRYELVTSFNDVDDDILKVTICDFNGSENNSDKHFAYYKDKLQVTVSGQIWLDITANGVNKGVAIRKLQEMFDIKHEETMAFGDYLNDLEMMESAYHSYAMNNAHEDLKKVARFIAKSNDENGVVEAIKEVVGI